MERSKQIEEVLIEEGDVHIIDFDHGNLSNNNVVLLSEIGCPFQPLRRVSRKEE